MFRAHSCLGKVRLSGRLATATLGILAASVATWAGPPKYVATQLSSASVYVGATWYPDHGGMNALGQVVGLGELYGQRWGGALYSGGQASLFGPSDAAALTGINNSGEVIGYTTSEAPFLYSNGVETYINVNENEYHDAVGINSSGQVCGTGDYNGDSAFIYSDGAVTFFGDSNDGGGSYAYALNDSGIVVGKADIKTGPDGFDHDEQAVEWVDGNMVIIGTLGGDRGLGFSDGEALGINAEGDVVGDAFTSSATIYGGPDHAFLYKNGVISDLGTLGLFTSGNNSLADSINDYDVAVGVSDYRACLFEDGNVYDLESLVTSGLDDGLADAVAINDSGQILVQSYNTGAYILTPVVPGPSSLGVFCFGALAVARRRLSARGPRAKS